MACRNCGNEVNGIKLNGKLFCPLCGVSLDESPEPVEPKEERPDVNIPVAKTINANQEIENEINILDAELKVLDVLAEEEPTAKQEEPKEINLAGTPKVPSSKIKISKAERVRIGRPTVEQKIEMPEEVTEEPTPIPVQSLPEVLPSTEPTKISPFLDKEEINAIESKKASQKNLFNNYLKTNLSGLNPNNKKKVKKKRKNTKPIIIALSMLATVIVTLGFGAWLTIFYYQPNASLRRAEATYAGDALTPNYIPAGFRLSGDTSSNGNEITLAYVKPGSNDKITITETGIENGKTLEYFSSPNESFTSFEQSGTTYWVISENKVLVEKNEVGIEILSTGLKSSEELLKIAESFSE